MLLAQPIVGDAKMAGRKHVFVILVVLESSRLADQRIDHMAIIDGVLVAAGQARHPLNCAAGVPDLDEVRVDHHVHFVADQPAMNRIRVAFDLNRAAAADLDSSHSMNVIEPARRQIRQRLLFRDELVAARCVTLAGQSLEKLLVIISAGEVLAATQQQRLLDDRFEMAMRRLDVAILMRLADIDALWIDLVVIHQVAVTLAKLAVLREVVDRRAEAVGAVLCRPRRPTPKTLAVVRD